MKHLGVSTSFFLIALTYSDPVFAQSEWCQISNPTWVPSDGPISTFEELLLILKRPLPLAILVIFGIGFFVRQFWLYLITTILIAYFLLLEIVDRTIDDDRFYGHTIDGCRGTETAAFLVFGIVFCISAFFVSRFVLHWLNAKKRH